METGQFLFDVLAVGGLKTNTARPAPSSASA